MENTGKEKYFTTKKIIIILLSLAVIFAALAVIIHFTTKVTNETYEKCSVGDINGDGYINSIDALEAMKTVTGSVELFESQKKNGDVNLDGKLDSADALILLKYCIGEIDEVPFTEKVADDVKNDSKSMTYEDENLVVSAKILNEWKNTDGTTSYQINLTAKNSRSKVLEDWTAKISFNEAVKISKKWDCSASVDKNTVEISGDDVPTSSAIGCGLIVICEKSLSINNIEMG